jgi:hypothetical protein
VYIVETSHSQRAQYKQEHIAMETLAEFQARALAEVRLPELKDPLIRLFHRFVLDDARAIVQLTNRLPGSRDGVIEKGAAGAAVVAAAMRHYYGQYDGTGMFDFQYDYWGDRDPDARFPVRKMDIIFVMPTNQSTRGSVAFQVEAKNYRKVTASTLANGNIALQVQKDDKYANPWIKGHAPLVPVWWFLQGLDDAARNHLEAKGFRVIDFMTNPFRTELSRAFQVPESLRLK